MSKPFSSGTDGCHPKDLEQPCVVAVATADSLWLGEVMTPADPLPCDLADQVDKLINGDQSVGTKIQRFVVVRAH